MPSSPDAVSGWNDTATEYEHDQSIRDVWAQRVADDPDAIAIEDSRRRLTYRELDAAATSLARRFGEQLAGDEPCVGVLAERSIDAVVAFLAVLKAGGAYVPLDPQQPDERLRFMLDDTGSALLLAQHAYVEQARRLASTVVDISDTDADADTAGYQRGSLGPRSLVYVMYTSGTTGRPKGVAIEHRGVLRYARGARDLMPHPGEAMLFVNQLGFDGSTYELWGALLNGARLAVHTGSPTPVAIARTIAGHGATVSMLPTGLFHQLVDWAHSDQDGATQVSQALAGMRLVLAAGDVLSPSHARRFLHRAPQCRLVNAYGPTEATVTGSVYDVTQVRDDESVPIGRPLANTTLYVLDEDLQPVPHGQRGELFIGGDGVARGYLNLPDVTAERFVPDPFGGGDDGDGDGDGDGRLYRTGDFVRMRPDGQLEYLGRIDDQVKIRGYRVEPGEIEAVLNTHPLVRQSIVVAREDLPGHKRLVAYVTSAADLDTTELRTFAAQRVPQYLMPSVFVLLDEFPLTDNGKPDRGALPAPAATSSGREPKTDTEWRVAEAFEAVLKHDGVSADDDFFELGGDSLLAIQMLSMLHHTLAVTLPMDLVFDARTVAGIAAGADRLLADGSSVAPGLPPLPSLPPAQDGTEEPVSVSQQLALFHTELADSALPYQSQAIIWFVGALDVRVLEQAMSAVVARHEILRTTFARRGPGWVQRVHDPEPIVLAVHDLRGEGDPHAAFDRLKAERFGRRIDLGRTPIIQWTLARVSDTRWALLQMEHHVVHDGASFATLLGELSSCYRAIAAGALDSLAPVRTQYRQFARWQRALAGTDAGQRQLAYWTQQLAELPPPPDLPTDRDHPATPTYRGASVSRDLQANVAEAVRALAADAGATPYMVMLSAFFALLHRCSGQQDLVVGSGLAARRLPELADMLGMAVNTVALRVQVDGTAPARDVIDAVRRCCLQAHEHQELPFEEVVQHVAPRRTAGRSPVYQHLFSFHDAPLPDLDLDGVRVVAEDVQSNFSAKADINVVVVNRRSTDDPRSGTLRVVWEYASDVYDAATADRMLGQYLVLLEAMVTDPARPLGTLALITPDERAALVTAGQNVRPYERDAAIVDVFNARVRADPGAVAIASGTVTVTYGKLAAAAAAVAERLRAEGVRPGDRVAVVDDRTPAMIASLLGVLAAGAAYVGVDPAQPTARLEAVLRDASVRVACASAARSLPGVEVVVSTAQLLDAADASSTAPLGAVQPSSPTDLAYVSFTSGSTGTPKGVAVPHRGVVRLVRNADYVCLGADERVLAMAPLSFDASTFEIWGALLNGARIVLAPPGPLSTAEIATVLRDGQVSVAWFTAAIFHELVDRELAALRGVRQLLAGGDVLSPPHVNRLLRAMDSGSVLVNGYGPTEGTTFTTAHRMNPGTEVRRRVPIGRPIANTAAYVVDAAGEPVPAGVVGELWAGGDGIARGYLGRDDLTAQAFATDPFRADDDPDARTYRTGDLVRLSADGTIDFLGRADRQVKVRGHRVEPAEAEAALLRRADVRQAYVDVAQYGPDDRRLVAYVVGSGAERPASAELRRQLSAELPAYLVPAAFVWLDELPVTSSGKLDRAALPAAPSTWFDSCAPDDPQRALERTVAGATKNERALLAIWQEVLGIRDIGLDDDFFDLGGHSLLAVSLFAGIERTIGARLPLSTIFSARTVRRLADVLRSDGWDASWGSLVALQAVGTAGRNTGERPPVFAVTAGDGNVVGFGPLSRRLGSDQPFYVLQPHGLDGRALLHRTVPAMARSYVREIRRVQPTGPYLLAGRCFGALVAVEMTRQLEARGQRVALLAAIDSLGPLWSERTLANGLRYDEVMNLALARARDAGVTFGDVFADVGAADAFVEWLRGEAARDGDAVVSRYLEAAYLARPDLRAAYPLDAHGHAGLVDWAWVGGRSEMGMNPLLLATPSEWAAQATPSVDPRRRSRRVRVGQRALDFVDLATRGRVPALAQRRRQRILDLATENVLDYRAGPFAAPVVLLRSQDDEDDTQKAQLARWYGLQSGGVRVEYVNGTHHGMLREPDVATLAEVLDRCITEALAGARTRA